jgi:hypothetical protein
MSPTNIDAPVRAVNEESEKKPLAPISLKAIRAKRPPIKRRTTRGSAREKALNPDHQYSNANTSVPVKKRNLA